MNTITIAPPPKTAGPPIQKETTVLQALSLAGGVSDNGAIGRVRIARIIGDEKRDPIARAVYIDPAMPLAWWMVGRFRAARGEWGLAREAFTRAAIDRPQSVAFRADEASAGRGTPVISDRVQRSRAALTNRAFVRA